MTRYRELQSLARLARTINKQRRLLLKARVVADWVSNPRSLALLAADHGLPVGSVRTWIDKYCNEKFKARV